MSIIFCQDCFEVFEPNASNCAVCGASKAEKGMKCASLDVLSQIKTHRAKRAEEFLKKQQNSVRTENSSDMSSVKIAKNSANILTLIIIILGGYFFYTHNFHSSAVTPVTATPAAMVGEVAQDGSFAFTLLDTPKCDISRVGNNELYEDATGQFCEIRLKVSNVKNAPESFSDTAQVLIDTSGRSFSADTTADTYALVNSNNSTSAYMSDINPGLSKTFELYFDLPKGDKPQSLIAHDSAFSNGVEIITDSQIPTPSASTVIPADYYLINSVYYGKTTNLKKCHSSDIFCFQLNYTSQASCNKTIWINTVFKAASDLKPWFAMQISDGQISAYHMKSTYLGFTLADFKKFQSKYAGSTLTRQLGLVQSISIGPISCAN